MELSRLLLAGLMCSLAVSQSGPGEVFQKVEDSAHFLQAGTAILAEERADLVLDFDLYEVRDVVDGACQLAKEVVDGSNRTGIVRQLRYRLFIICKDHLKRWRALHDIFTGDAEPPSNQERLRNKRFAAAAVILSSLAAGIAGDLWGQHQTREDLLRLADQQNRMIAVLQKDETRLNMEADHQREIEQILGSVQEKEELLQVLGQGLDVVIATFVSAGSELTRLERIAQGILMDGKVHPGAYPPGMIRKLMKDVREMGAKRGLVPAPETELDFTRLAASFGTFSSGKVRVVVHVPMASPNEVYLLWRYTNMARRVKASSVFGQVDPAQADRILAVRQDGTRYFEATASALASCWRRGDSKSICDPVPVRPPKSWTCLWAIHQGNQKKVLEHCTIVAAREEPVLKKAGSGRWLLCHREGHFATVSCGGQTTASVVARGCWWVRLSAGCTLDSEGMQLKGRRGEVVEEIVLHRPPVELHALNMSELIQRVEANKWKPADSSPGTHLHYAGRIRFTRLTPAPWNLVVLGFSSAGIVTVLLGVAGYVAHRRHLRSGKRLGKRMDTLTTEWWGQRGGAGHRERECPPPRSRLSLTERKETCGTESGTEHRDRDGETTSEELGPGCSRVVIHG